MEQASSPQPGSGPSLVLTDEGSRHVRLTDAVAVRFAELVRLDPSDLASRLEEGPREQAWRLAVHAVPVNRP